jgi:vitamin B12 transporter
MYFQRRMKEAIAFFFDPVTFASRYINQDKQRDRGFELDARMAFDEKLQLKLFYAYVKGDVTTKTAGKDTTYFNLFRRPQNTLTLQAGSQLTKAFYVSANFQWVSNTQDVSFEPPFYEQQIVKLRNYALINLYAEYVLLPKKLRLFADVRNLTDAHYQTIYGYASPRFNAYGGFRFSL